jgi:hypothetical protein
MASHAGGSAVVAASLVIAIAGLSAGCGWFSGPVTRVDNLSSTAFVIMVADNHGSRYFDSQPGSSQIVDTVGEVNAAAYQFTVLDSSCQELTSSLNVSLLSEGATVTLRDGQPPEVTRGRTEMGRGEPDGFASCEEAAAQLGAN